MPSAGGQWRAIRHYLSLSNLNSEVEKLLQRLKPASPDQWHDLIRRFEKAISVRLMQDGKQLELNKSATVQCTAMNDAAKMESQVGEKKAEKKDMIPTEEAGSGVVDVSVQGLLLGLKRKKDLHLGKFSEASWKSNKPIVNKSSIHSRTAYVVSALAAAQSGASLAARAEDLARHLQQYPEARELAVREGAVRALLRVRRRLAPDCAAAGAVAEALALAGHADPPRAPGPRILALDGGGIRGLISIEVLRHLERLAGRPVEQLFDYIIGVSTGAIIAAAIGSGAGTLETASEMYRTLSREMFGNTSVIGGTSRLVWTHSYYDTALWERMLHDNFGDVTLVECNRKANPKMALLSCVVNAESRLAPFLFRTYCAGGRVRGAVRGTCAARVWHAVRASAAAPTYFDEFRLDGLVHQDGGLMVNNPAGVGVHEARLLFGAAALRRAVLVSVGTGRAPAAPPAPSERGTSWREKFYKVLDSATDTEGVHLLLGELLPASGYFRLNPPLLAPVAMDEVSPARLQAMLDDTAAYLRRNQHKLQRAAAALTRPRPRTAAVADELRERAVLLGLRDRC